MRNLSWFNITGIVVNMIAIFVIQIDSQPILITYDIDNYSKSKMQNPKDPKEALNLLGLSLYSYDKLLNAYHVLYSDGYITTVFVFCRIIPSMCSQSDTLPMVRGLLLVALMAKYLYTMAPMPIWTRN